MEYNTKEKSVYSKDPLRNHTYETSSQFKYQLSRKPVLRYKEHSTQGNSSCISNQF